MTSFTRANWPVATGLLLVRVVDLVLAADRLAVGHLRGTDVRLDLELATHAVDEDVEVKFAHALHDGLTAFEVGLHAEGRVFGSQTGQSDAHLFLVGLGLRFDRDLDHRDREGHGFQNDGLRRITERVARWWFPSDRPAR